MVFNELGRFEKMEDPAPREPKELKRAEGASKAKLKHTKAKTPGSVTVKTVRRSTTFAVALIWLIVLAVLVVGVYKLFGVFTSG